MSREDEIRKLLEEIDPKGELPQDRIETFIESVKDLDNNPPKDGDRIGDMYMSVLEEDELKRQIEEEPDWRKKASLAARIISNNLG